MADDVIVVSVVGESSGKKDESSDYDPALDFFSDKFDPLKALNTPGLKPPVGSARTFDNLARYESSCKQISAGQDGGKKKPEKAKPETPLERRWLPHQLPVQGTTKKRNNILTRMEAIFGPLKLLKKCVEERLLVKVFTRNATGIRGYCSGYITVFDKHWNMCLENVTEVWTRSKKRKVAPIDAKPKPKRSSSRNRIKLPEVTIIKSDKKTELCKRTVPQLMVRGEQVALVSVADVGKA